MSALADAQSAAGDKRGAIKTFERSLDTLAASGHDSGSVASKVRTRLVATLLDCGLANAALKAVQGMLAYARNVHITEHDVTMKCLEGVVAALIERGQADKALDAAKTLHEVWLLPPYLYVNQAGPAMAAPRFGATVRSAYRRAFRAACRRGFQA